MMARKTRGDNWLSRAWRDNTRLDHEPSHHASGEDNTQWYSWLGMAMAALLQWCRREDERAVRLTKMYILRKKTHKDEDVEPTEFDETNKGVKSIFALL
ncbi:hypothetical protein RJT34_15862 [Clitoria ternatea]|uniref:Uncharacterized protein n=1 Tax=Clitoria ternatea TaxID=43366 RepID=A0AAN9J6F2_CLITE